VKLQGKVFQALVALLEKPGEVVTRESAPQSPVALGYARELRCEREHHREQAALGPRRFSGPAVFVDTIPRKGYSFVAAIDIWTAGFAAKSGTRRKIVSRWGSVARRIKKFSSPRGASSKWFAAGVISLVLAGMLFGAALMLYSHRGI